MAGHSKKGASEKAHVVLIDETGLQLSPLRRRSWATRGQRPILRQLAGTREKISVIGALSLSPKTYRPNLYFQTLPKCTFNSDRVAAFLRELLKHLRGKVIIVWDNGSMHKGEAMRQLRRDFPRLSIEWLPPYAPELNPVEQLWSHLKFGYCANLIPDDIEHLADEALDFLIYTRVNPKRLQSYWNATPLAEPVTKLIA
jgi:DDE superfamily endonuclease